MSLRASNCIMTWRAGKLIVRPFHWYALHAEEVLDARGMVSVQGSFKNTLEGMDDKSPKSTTSSVDLSKPSSMLTCADSDVNCLADHLFFLTCMMQECWQ